MYLILNVFTRISDQVNKTKKNFLNKITFFNSKNYKLIHIFDVKDAD